MRTVFFAFLTAFLALPLAAPAFFAVFLAEDFALLVAAEIFRATLLPNVRALLRAALRSRKSRVVGSASARVHLRNGFIDRVSPARAGHRSRSGPD